MPSRQDVAAIFPGRTPIDAMKAFANFRPTRRSSPSNAAPQGAIAHQRNAPDYLTRPSAAQRAVDETGAGDAFCGGALVGFSRRLALGEALAHAAVSASFAVEAVGPSALVSASPQDAEQRLSHGRQTESRPVAFEPLGVDHRG